MMNRALKHAIVDSGRTQRAIARQTRIDETLLSRYVNGWDDPDERDRKQLAKVLKKTEAELFGGSASESAA